MSESDAGEKTEEPTDRRINHARQQGTVAKSVDLSQVLGLIAAVLALQFAGPRLWQSFVLLIKGSFTSRYSTEPWSVDILRSNFSNILTLFIPDLLLIAVVAGFVGGGVTAIQTKFLWSNKLLRPKFSQLNPISGIKRIFGAQNAVNVLKNLAKLAVISPIAYYSFFDLFPELMRLMDIPVANLLEYTGYAIDYIFWRIIALLIVLAIIDYIWQRYHTKKQLKMTKSEVKDERKSVEGDEATKRQILAKAMQRARERMMQDVPSADVVITNPTHIAVALQYDMKPGSAPKVVAKGKGFVAQRIKKIAREHGIPTVERKPLARALFKAVEVGQFIPYELYAAVAEILAYVYRIKGKMPQQQSSKPEEAEVSR